MPNYLLAYHGGGTPEGEEAQAAVMEAWNDWLDETGDAMLDLGSPVGATRTVQADGSVSEAPAVPVTGYSIVEAEDMEGAIAIARGCPILVDGGSVEVAELIDSDFDDDEEDEDDEDED
ncbi:MAG: hypothetical protein JWQ89_3103 [Devosia sp.]|uniref:YciI family protein n=1 Tax=Devosia sp. TaxID=1871048 RepID=UPI00260C7BF7|nr:YciI family protein [Devosia sp.]MDB5541376.1 hypothetical protein [Devosia sp.]